MPDSPDHATTSPNLDQARTTIAAAVRAAAGDQGDGSQGELVKVGEAGATFGLAFNGVPIPLEGQEVATLGRDELQPFFDRHADAIEAGEHDDVIRGALDKGPGNVTARVRAVSERGFTATEE